MYRLGMLGGGTVGGGVYEILSSRSNIVISKICVRSLEKTRDFEIDPKTTTLTTDVNELLGDDIDCLVEVAGGSSGVVKDTVFRALQAGKSVVTANKALLAEHMTEIQAILAQQPKARIGYEASVCGGIPIIQALSTCYTGDQIHSLQGIMNGTTNYMLSAMAKDTTVSYDAILKEAQDLGYAEADPTADVEGHDVRAKIAILAQLAFGCSSIPVETIPCTGISSITSTDFAWAAERSATIKLIGTAAVQNDGSSLAVYVTPTIVGPTSLLASIQGSGNCVAVTSHNMGGATVPCLYTGPGAGRFPTANSIVADIDRAATASLPPTAFTVSHPDRVVVADYTAESFYLRIAGTPSLANVFATTVGSDVPVQSVVVKDGHTILTTGPAQQSAVAALSKAIGCAVFMPILP